MLQYLIVLLDGSAPSFCHYAAPETGNWMDIDTLRGAVHFALTHSLAVNVVVGRREIPAALLAELDRVNHILIGPPEATEDCVWDVMTVDGLDTLLALTPNTDKNVILRCSRAELDHMVASFTELNTRFGRVNVVLTDIPAFTDHDLQSCAEARYFCTGPAEADRRCNAGVTHITIAPDGHFYICPAFYYEPLYPDCGALPAEPVIPDSELLDLQHAPLCRGCNALHCRRCVYLNIKTTREINTPSRRQCLTARPTDPFDTYEK